MWLPNLAGRRLIGTILIVVAGGSRQTSNQADIMTNPEAPECHVLKRWGSPGPPPIVETQLYRPADDCT